VVAGGSLSFHIFEAPLSFIEADLDSDHPESAVVITIGPDQANDAIETVSTIIEAVQTGTGLGEAMMSVYDFIRETADRAIQGRGVGYRGCLFSSSPACSQLVYDGGFTSVYTLEPDFSFESLVGLPVPILFVVFDKSSGTVYVDTPVFLPFIVRPEP
jgi:hypothetical protein